MLFYAAFMLSANALVATAGKAAIAAKSITLKSLIRAIESFLRFASEINYILELELNLTLNLNQINFIFQFKDLTPD